MDRLYGASAASLMRRGGPFDLRRLAQLDEVGLLALASFGLAQRLLDGGAGLREWNHLAIALELLLVLVVEAPHPFRRHLPALHETLLDEAVDHERLARVVDDLGFSEPAALQRRGVRVGAADAFLGARDLGVDLVVGHA